MAYRRFTAMTHPHTLRRAALFASIAAAISLAGCSKSSDTLADVPLNDSVSAQMNGAAADSARNAATPAAAPAAGAVPPTDAWVGRWLGPEGLFLDITKDASGGVGHYAIVNRDNLDREESYSGVAEGSTIRFVRDGKDLVIQPGTGADTGFKYLADKTDCLIVVKGSEGYCR